jgi:tRNA A37 threonylcarbamoyltransferase TsaD
MIALLGAEMLKVGMIAQLDIGVDPSWEIQASSQK